jgi:glycosyltransferase involved in cell wall biosynthesis
MALVSVILPLYRTAAALEELYARLCAVLEPAPFEIIAVDDACPEGSGAGLAAIAARDRRVVAIHLPSNTGQQRAVWLGLQRARGQHIVIMDADLQDRPEDIPALLAALAAHPVQAAFAGRRGAYQGPTRMATSVVFKRLLHLIAGVPPDAGSFVAMTRTMADAVLRLRARHPYMLALIGATGLPVVSIPVPRASRPSGRSAYSEWARLRFASRGLRTALLTRLQNRGNSWTQN